MPNAIGEVPPERAPLAYQRLGALIHPGPVRFQGSADVLLLPGAVTLGREFPVEQIPYAKKERKLPVVLSREGWLPALRA